jgi:hypothetical protein
MAMLEDIDRNTVDFQANFDDRLQEPTVLPAKIPNLLVNGSSGIAVGMATNIPPHNLREVVKAVQLLVDNPEATIGELRKAIKGPDFPTVELLTLEKNRYAGPPVELRHGKEWRLDGHSAQSLCGCPQVFEGHRNGGLGVSPGAGPPIGGGIHR